MQIVFVNLSVRYFAHIAILHQLLSIKGTLYLAIIANFYFFFRIYSAIEELRVKKAEDIKKLQGLISLVNQLEDHRKSDLDNIASNKTEVAKVIIVCFIIYHQTVERQIGSQKGFLTRLSIELTMVHNDGLL